MQVTFKGRRVTIQVQTIALVALMAGGALYYYFSTMAVRGEGPASVLFIKPLVWGILVCLPFVVWGAVKVEPINPQEQSRKTPSQAQEDRMFDHRRVFFGLALVAYAASLALFGYLLPSVVFMVVVCWYLGTRNWWLLLVLSTALPAFLSFVFKQVLAVPIPIWPAW